LIIDLLDFAAGLPAITQDFHELYVKGALNYEIQNNYNMSIYAEDEYGRDNLPAPATPRTVFKTRNHKVEVQVININEPPKFYEVTSTCEVYENTVRASGRTQNFTMNLPSTLGCKR
jgi:uncharacterized membrane-anchored protein